ncbi:MAG TPA: mechanosensitive ion channel family protein [Candidatus Polarisedimenticolia bacterium]|nr:mechanosensitive ion channel family protein [Candidatus Polarisedimenticolia bacterium]
MSGDVVGQVGQTMQSLSPAALGEMWRAAWVNGLIALVAWLLVFLVAHAFVMRLLRKIAARTAWTWDDVLIAAIAWPTRLLILASGLTVLERILPLEPEWDRACDIMLAAAFALAFVLFVDRMTSGLLDRMAHKNAAFQGTRGLVQGAVRGLIIGIGLLIFLDSIGISIAPILASLGVGSLAVALALQDTLANVFAGFHLIADKPLEAGQFIRLQSGEEGHVVLVGWRSTRLKTPQNNIVVVPNAKLAGTVLTNFDLGTSAMAITVEVTVSLASDLEKAERIAMDVAREVQRTVPGGSSETEPAVRFIGFGDSGMRFNVILNSENLKTSNDVRHEFLKRLSDRYRREGIVIPFPTRTLDFPAGTPVAGPQAGFNAGRPGPEARS